MIDTHRLEEVLMIDGTGGDVKSVEEFLMMNSRRRVIDTHSSVGI